MEMKMVQGHFEFALDWAVETGAKLRQGEAEVERIGAGSRRSQGCARGGHSMAILYWKGLNGGHLVITHCRSCYWWLILE